MILAQIVLQRGRVEVRIPKIGALFVALTAGRYGDKITRLVVLQLHNHVAVVQRTNYFCCQFLQLIVCDLFLLVGGLKLRQIVVVNGVPVQSVVSLVVPQCIVLVQTIPQYLELAGIAVLCLGKRQYVFVGVVHQCVALLMARAKSQHEESCSYDR